MTQYYDEYTPTYADRASWTSPRVLRDRAARHPHRTYLEVPWAGESYTFAETLDLAERVGSGMLAAGAQPGDRVLIMIPNCSAYIFAWLGSSVAGLVEVPINTAYRGSFLAHQVRTTEPVLAVIAPEFVERIVDVPDAVISIRHYFVVGDDAAVAAGISELRAGRL